MSNVTQMDLPSGSAVLLYRKPQRGGKTHLRSSTSKVKQIAFCSHEEEEFFAPFPSSRRYDHSGKRRNIGARNQVKRKTKQMKNMKKKHGPQISEKENRAM